MNNEQRATSNDKWRLFGRNPKVWSHFYPIVVVHRAFRMTKPCSLRLARGKNDLKQ